MAFDAATYCEDAYLDVRLRVTVGCKLENFHVLAISMKETHKGQLIFDLVYQTLEGVFDSIWRIKFISFANECAKNMASNVQEYVDRLQGVCLLGFLPNMVCQSSNKSCYSSCSDHCNDGIVKYFFNLDNIIFAAADNPAI